MKHRKNTIVDDLNKTLPVSNTPPPSTNVGSVGSFPPSNPTPSISSHSPSPSVAPTTPVAHEADSLDKILADLEAQLKAKQGEIVVEAKKDSIKNVVKEPVIIESSKITSSPITQTASSLPVIKKPAEIVVEEKHDLMNIKNDVKVDGKNDSVPLVKPASSLLNTALPISEPVKSVAPSPSEHPFVPGAGVTAALKKVIPEAVGAVNVTGMSSMKKDTAVPTPVSMPGIGNMTSGGITSSVKPKKRTHFKAIVGVVILFLTVFGTTAGIMSNLQPGGVFDYRRYAADNMCNVNPGSCQNEQDWIDGWFEARQPENSNATPQQDEMTNANDNQNPDGDGPKQEIIRHAGETGVGDPGKGNRTDDQTPTQAGTPQPGTTTSICSAAEKSGCGGANQGYCVCGGAKEKVCNTGFKTLGGDCVPLTTMENTTGKPGDLNAHCQANNGCANGLICSDHTCSTPPKVVDPATTITGGKTGDIPIPGTGGKLVMRDGKIVVLDFVAGQTIGNTCDLPNSKCDTYDKWVEGYYKARKPESFGLVAPAGKPIYTDILTDLDPTTANTQVGTIKYNSTTKEWYIDGIATLNLDSKLSDDAKKAQSNNGGISVSSLATAYTINPDGTLKYSGQTLTGPAASIPKDWQLAVGGVCKSGDLTCGDSSKQTGFCVPGGTSGQYGCDHYFNLFGIAIRYQDFGKNYNDASLVYADCGSRTTTPRSSTGGNYGEITCTGDIYSICVDHYNGTFTCYAKNLASANNFLSKVTTFSLSQNGDCLTNNGGAIIAAYSCPPGTSGGCQSETVKTSSSSKICIDEVVAAVGGCGKTIQIDANDSAGNHYSINQWLPECGSKPVEGPPQRVTGPPPTTNEVCTTNCGGPEPTPSPAPPGSPICIGISASIPAPVLGQAPTFTCSPAAEATRYEFRSKITGLGAYSALAPSAANSNVSSPLTVNTSGVYTIQCRPCNANGCANWENL